MHDQPVSPSFVQESKVLWDENIVPSKVLEFLNVYCHNRNAMNSTKCIVMLILALLFCLLFLRENGQSSFYSNWIQTRRQRGQSFSPGRGKNFLHVVQPLILKIPGDKAPGCEADHSTPTSAEVKKTWIYIFIPPIHLHGVVLN
jgi:hypothetical protein